MLYQLENRLFRREIDAGTSRFSNLKSIYGDKHWVDNLDIVNELGGHHGCVNALSWSKSGRLLASGSDDTNLLLHAYQPEHSTSPFSLTTSIVTGHTQNIFSVKFMPHSNDNTLVSAAGDSEVRVFDIEYSRRPRATSTSSLAPSGGSTFDGVKYLSEGNTNARVYRSHSDRVKRIVTESSPHLFLTCSEDGEVRQWDLRLPSSAYPSARGTRGYLRRNAQNSTDVPPPLISYKKYRLDLNTISCSGSQPHYIVLGGAHLHCFLHDRRMLGRDLSDERGSPASLSSLDEDLDGDAMGQATQCVRRFAPHGKKKMGANSNGHVTACKISDASPNEMIASWSGDHIYSFDLIRSPDAREQASSKPRVVESESKRSRHSKNRKRKRPTTDTNAEAHSHSTSRARRLDSPSHGDMALRVRYENGQSEDISLERSSRESALENIRESMLTETQQRSLSIAKSLVKIRKCMFSLEDDDSEREAVGESNLPKRPFIRALETASSTLFEMDAIVRSWTYPVDPSPDELAVHRELRQDRDSARRFVQAAGSLSFILGRGALPPLYDIRERFGSIKAPSTEGPFLNRAEIFRYDFLKAIVAWLQGGKKGLYTAFLQNPTLAHRGARYPVPSGSTSGAINEHLIPYLLGLAGSSPIPNVDASRFEVDENRFTFTSEAAAVRAFAEAVDLPDKRARQVAELANAQAASSSSSKPVPQSAASDTQRPEAAAVKFWGFKVGRGLLLNAAERVNFSVTHNAFGGLDVAGAASDTDSGRAQSDIDPDEEELLVDNVQVARPRQRARRSASEDSEEDGPSHTADLTPHSPEQIQDLIEGIVGLSEAADFDGESEEDTRRTVGMDLGGEDGEDGDDDGDEDDDEDAEDDNDESDDDDEASNDELTVNNRRIIWRSSSDRARLRATVDAGVPVTSHLRSYQGHCNVKTVKDVNFYGLNDEYVVSGSDSGHVFMWERATSKLVNILEGDGEVVNVVQGHPYEPLLAVSGIDHTVKIFSPDARAQRDAKLGRNLNTSANGTSWSSRRGSRFFARPTRPSPQYAAGRGDSGSLAPMNDDRTVDENDSQSSEDDNDIPDEMEDLSAGPNNGLSSRRRMHESYQIVAQNDIERQSGQRDAFITRSMLAQLAAHMRARRRQQGTTGDEPMGGDGDDEEGGEPLMLDDDCTVM